MVNAETAILVLRRTSCQKLWLRVYWIGIPTDQHSIVDLLLKCLGSKWKCFDVRWCRLSLKIFGTVCCGLLNIIQLRSSMQCSFPMLLDFFYAGYYYYIIITARVSKKRFKSKQKRPDNKLKQQLQSKRECAKHSCYNVAVMQQFGNSVVAMLLIPGSVNQTNLASGNVYILRNFVFSLIPRLMVGR